MSEQPSQGASPQVRAAADIQPAINATDKQNKSETKVLNESQTRTLPIDSKTTVKSIDTSATNKNQSLENSNDKTIKQLSSPDNPEKAKIIDGNSSRGPEHTLEGESDKATNSVKSSISTESSQDTNTEIVPPADSAKSSQDTNIKIVPPADSVKSSQDINTKTVPPADSAKSSQDTNTKVAPPADSAKSSQDTNTKVAPSADSKKSSQDTTTKVAPPKDSIKSSQDTNTKIVPPADSAKSSQDPNTKVAQPADSAKSSLDINTKIVPPADSAKSSQDPNTKVVPSADSIKSSQDTTTKVAPPKGSIKSSQDPNTKIVQPADSAKSSQDTKTVVVKHPDSTALSSFVKTEGSNSATENKSTKNNEGTLPGKENQSVDTTSDAELQASKSKMLMETSDVKAVSPAGQTDQSNDSLENTSSDLSGKGMVSETKTNQVPSSDSKNESEKDAAGKNSSTEAKAKIDAMLTGQCSFSEIPPLPKKIVRIFVSSTFTDTKEERNALMQYIYPKLSEFCREKHGLEFQVVDMRWGVPEAASDNHSTTQLCLQEIRKCQQVSVGPNFVAIVGDKYGYRPIPSQIDSKLFEILRHCSKDVTSTDCDWAVVEEWYQQDENAVPSLYILQPISARLQHFNNMENPELRKEAQNNWNEANQQLTTTLRQAAGKAFEMKKITENEKELFYRSVTENEIHEGMSKGRTNPDSSCICIIRKITDLDKNLTDPKAGRFTDVQSEKFNEEAQNLLDNLKKFKVAKYIPESNLTRVDIEWLASGAKISVDKFKDLDISKFVQDSLQYQESQVTKYKTYLEQLCEEFFLKVSRLIDEGGIKEKQLYDDLTSEVLQHWHLAKLRCEVFEGRGDLLASVQEYLKGSFKPLVIHGNSGSGKTSVMAMIMKKVANQVWKSHKESQFMMIARFLGTSPNTSNVHQLLVSMCKQIAVIYEKEWEEPEKFSELVKSFNQLLTNASEDKPILILLDSIDQLMPAYNAFKLGWLPTKLPGHVKLLLSTISEGYPILQNSKEKYGNELKVIEVKPLGTKLGLEVINKWLNKDGRRMTNQQTEIIEFALQKCSLPLYARIAYDHIKRWKSYDTPNTEELETTVRGAINKLFESVEQKFGIGIVKHSLSYLTASRHGLSEAEIEHLLSLDDKLLNEVFKFWKPPVRRIPPLMWTRIRSDIHSYLVERSADDSLVLFWYHRQFIEATKERYLKEQEFARYVHSNLVEYFTGKWGGGKEKVFEYTDAQVARFGLKSPKSKADRKVPLQPYITGWEHEYRYNKRKLSELPFHLIKCKDYKELKKSVFFNYEWLYAKLCSSSAQQLLEEFEIFMQADKIMKKDGEMRNLYVNLQLIRPYISRYPNSLAYELCGRMAKFLGKSDAVTSLLQGCDTIGIKNCPVIPLVTSFETADIGLSQNITFRKSEPWQEGGVFTCSSDFKTMYIFDYDQKGAPMVLIWDIATGEKVNSFPVDKTKDESLKSAVDVYIQAEVTKNGKYLLGFYRQKFVEGYTHRYRQHGLVDVIDVENGKVLQTYEGFLYREEFYNPLQYLTENHVCARFGVKNPIYNITEGTKREINRPTLLSQDEQYFIMCGQKKTELKYFASNDVIGEFDVSETQLAIAATVDFSIVAMLGSETKQLKIFDLGKKQLHANKKYGFLLKYKKVFRLEEKVAATVNDLFKQVVTTNEKGETEEKTNNRVVMTVAPDDRHLSVVFRGTTEWVGYIWNMGRWNAKFVGAVTDRMPLHSKFPAFNFDGTCVGYSKDKDILIYSTEDGQQMNKYEMSDVIKDFYMSQNSNKIAVMQSKSVVLLNISKSEGLITGKGKRNKLNKTSEVLVEREIATSYIHKEVVITHMPGSDHVEVDELKDIGMAAKTDRLASARSKMKHAIDKRVTPNGLKVLHYHTRVQVIDTKTEQIIYTPQKKDLIIRVCQKPETTSTENIKIPGMEPGERSPKVMDLLQGDRIVNENNKVKFRVNQEPNGQFKIMNVPSIVTVYSAEEEKLQRLHRISVYQEGIVAVGNSAFITAKKTASGHFIKVYDLNTGKDLATHEISGGCDCAKFSHDEVQLFIVDRTLTVRVYLSPDYNALEQKISLQAGEISAAFIVKDILTFKANRDAIVVRYGPEGDSTYVRSRYLHVNLVTKQISPEMEMKPCFEDISKDGEIGVDARLCLYKMSTGKVINIISYAGISLDGKDDVVPQGRENFFVRKLRYNDPTATMQLRVRISDDKKFIVYVDKHDDTLHVAECINEKVKHLFSCHTHVPNLLLSHGLELRYYGRLIVMRTDDSVVVPLAIRCSENEPRISYENEMSRALSIVDSVWSSATGLNLPNSDRNKANQLFLKKYDLRDEEDEDLGQNEDEQNEEQQKIFQVKSTSKPNVLVIGESIFSQFKPSRFTAHLSTQLKIVNTVDEAVKAIKSLQNTFDAIVLQLITDDVKYFDSKTCTEKILTCVEQARKKCRVVVLSLAPNRVDNGELNQRTDEINAKLRSQYSVSFDNSTGVVLCDNSNLSENGKPLHKYFKDAVNLNMTGVQQISINIKNTLQNALEMDII